MKEYLKKNGIRIGIIVAAVALIIGLGSAARNGKISLGQNAFGIFKAPVQKAMSSTVNWFNTIYGYLFDYDSLLADNESLRTQLAEAQQAARDGISASEENVRLREAQGRPLVVVQLVVLLHDKQGRVQRHRVRRSGHHRIRRAGRAGDGAWRNMGYRQYAHRR